MTFQTVKRRNKRKSDKNIDLQLSLVPMKEALQNINSARQNANFHRSISKDRNIRSRRSSCAINCAFKDFSRNENNLITSQENMNSLYL